MDLPPPVAQASRVRRGDNHTNNIAQKARTHLILGTDREDVPSATARHVIKLSFAATGGCVASLGVRLPPRAPPEPWGDRQQEAPAFYAPNAPPPERTHFLGYQREAARCPVSLADMELTDAATQRLW